MIFNVMWSPMGSTVYVFCALQKLHIVWNKRNSEARFARILVKSLKNKVSLIVYLAVIFWYFLHQTTNKSQHQIRDHFLCQYSTMYYSVRNTTASGFTRQWTAFVIINCLLYATTSCLIVKQQSLQFYCISSWTAMHSFGGSVDEVQP